MALEEIVFHFSFLILLKKIEYAKFLLLLIVLLIV